ncbi:BACON domain-containing protein [Variovorax paradoxus]|uniref:BACON domain-containing protein n=1 Tax=Variovorax paradoxus TaxID=34073 RepID=UPI000A58FFF6|nr:hypothetical protein [Variovorax paradoxus]
MTLKFTAIVGFCLALAACGGGGGGGSSGVAGAAPAASASSPADANNATALSFTDANGATVPLQAPTLAPISGLTASTASSRLPVDPGALAARAALPVPPPPPKLSALSTTVTLGGPNGRDEASQSISMSLNRDNKWPWTLSAPLPAWVTATPTSGTVDANGTSLSFSPALNAATPGTHSGVATVTATVNGGTATLPLTLVLNRDKRQLVPSESGIGFASTPGGSVLTRTLRVTDNFEGALPWAATSSASWLSVTGSGTTGTSPSLVLTADPQQVPMGVISYATVTLKTSHPGVADAVIRVGLWRAEGGLTALTPLPASYTNIVADKIRPYVYAHNGGTFIDIYNAHLGTKVGTIENVGAWLSDMSVAPDGGLLYVLDKGSGPIVVIDLASALKIATWPLMLKPGESYPQTLLAIRVNGKNVVLTGNGTAYIDGSRFAALPQPFSSNWNFTASSDGRRVFVQTTGLSPASVGAYDVDYSAMANGVLTVKYTAGAGFINGASNGQDIAVNAGGTALYAASGAPYRCSSIDPASLGFIASLPGGDAYPNNVEVTSDGRVICGINGLYSASDIWLHAPNGTLLKSFKFVGYARGLVPRQLVVTPDGMVAVALTDDPKMAFVPIGAP